MALKIFLPPLLQWSLSLEAGEYDIDVPFVAEHSINNYSLHFEQV